MLLSCPTCKSALEAPPDTAGQKIPCPKCGQRLLIPPADRNRTVLAGPPDGDDGKTTTLRVLPAVIPVPTPEPDRRDEEEDDRPRRRSRRRRDDDEDEGRSVARAVIHGALVAGLVLGFVGATGGAVLSQYVPVFGSLLERALAQPWSPARVGLAPLHAMVFGLAGLLFGALLGATLGYLTAPDD